MLPNNRKAAEAQLRTLEIRLERDPELKVGYSASIDSDVRNGYIRKLTANEVARTVSQRINYLTHHPVRHPKKPEKVRRVYNATAKYNG